MNIDRRGEQKIQKTDQTEKTDRTEPKKTEPKKPKTEKTEISVYIKVRSVFGLDQSEPKKN